MKKLLLPVLLLFLIFGNSARSQTDTLAENISIADTQDLRVTLFDTDDLFEISLSFDITRYRHEKMSEEYLEAILKYFDSENDSVIKKIKVRPRGNIRRTTICDFPPLMINFRMKDSDDHKFTGLNKLKMVTYCKLGFEDYIMREYLVYKMYNILTDNSFRVRLFRISYINTARERKPVVQFGFGIEPLNILEKRTGLQEILYPALSQRDINTSNLDLVAIFNYMIGNTDWSVRAGHNIQPMYMPEQGGYGTTIIIPYDFDFSGIVNTDYAAPFENLPIRSTRQRLYMAVCRSDEEFMSTLARFNEKKEELYRLINDFPYLRHSSRKDMINYLEGFYILINKHQKITDYLRQDCRWFESQANLRVR